MLRAFLFSLAISSAAYAECKIPGPYPVVQKKTVHKSVKVVKPAPVVLKETTVPANTELNADAVSSNSNANQNASKAVTGNQSVIVNVPAPVVRRVYHRKQVIVNSNPNRLLVLIGQSKTRNEIYETCCYIKSRNTYEQDFGIQYIRDFGDFSGSVLYTNEGNRYLGLGFNF